MTWCTLWDVLTKTTSAGDLKHLLSVYWERPDNSDIKCQSLSQYCKSGCLLSRIFCYLCLASYILVHVVTFSCDTHYLSTIGHYGRYNLHKISYGLDALHVIQPTVSRHYKVTKFSDPTPAKENHLLSLFFIHWPLKQDTVLPLPMKTTLPQIM